MKYDTELYELSNEKKWLELAKALKIRYTTGQSIGIFSEITGIPIHNANTLALWQYYVGHLTDEDLLQEIESWTKDDDLYANLIAIAKNSHN